MMNKNHQKTSRDGETQERVRNITKDRRTGDHILETQTSSGPTGTRPQVDADRGDELTSQWRRKDGTKEGMTQRVYRDTCVIEGRESGEE